MNLFNRIFTILSLLIVALLVFSILFIPSATLIPWTSILFNGMDSVQAALRALVGLILLIVVLLILWLEFRRPGSRTVEVARSTSGRIRITTGHVEERIAEQVDAMAGIIQAKVKVTERDNAVVTHVDAVAAPNTDLVTKGEDIAAKVREVVQDQLGLKLLGKPMINIKTAKLKPVEATPVTPTPSTGSTSGDKA